MNVRIRMEAPPLPCHLLCGTGGALLKQTLRWGLTCRCWISGNNTRKGREKSRIGQREKSLPCKPEKLQPTPSEWHCHLHC